KRIESLPDVQGNFIEIARIETGNDRASVGHACREMALIEGGLGGFEQETRRAGGVVGGFQFLFGGRVECDGAQRLCTRPAIFRCGGNGLVEGTQRWRRRNFFEKVGRIRIAGAEFVQPSCSGVSKISLREAVDGLLIKRASVSGISTSLGIA